MGAPASNAQRLLLKRLMRERNISWDALCFDLTVGQAAIGLWSSDLTKEDASSMISYLKEQ